MADQLNQNLLQNQLGRTQAAQQAKVAKTETVKTVQFADVMKSKQKSGNTTTVLSENPVAGNEVVKNAISGKKATGKLAVAANANTGSSSTVNNNTTGDAALTGSSDGTSAQQLLKASYQMQEMNQEFNLQYLNLQSNMQADSRQYTALSNVSKTKADTAKNSLSNVK